MPQKLDDFIDENTINFLSFQPVLSSHFPVVLTKKSYWFIVASVTVIKFSYSVNKKRCFNVFMLVYVRKIQLYYYDTAQYYTILHEIQ